jgi:MerR family transcriptional regulator, thiopeptide resistance regulator
MARPRWYQVKEVAELSGVSVRTLHHYDERGLLVPKRRTSAGYRLYDEQDLLRLQQILLGRELGLSLDAIQRALADPSFDRRAMLVAQRAELVKRAEETAAMLRAVDRALSVLEGGEMEIKEMFEGFDPARYDAESEQRWGDTEELRESRRRTQRYGREDWRRFFAEQEAIYGGLHAARVAGHPPSAPEVRELVERHRLSIDRWFYPCSHERHEQLADLYEQDPRFAASIDGYGAGLTPFLVAAIRSSGAPRGP